MAQIDVAEAHAVTTGDPSVVVGVLDSGITPTHPDLASQVANDQSASCLGGVVDTSVGGVEPDERRTTARTWPARSPAAINGVGIAGVAPGVKVASVKVVNDDGFIFPEAAICGYLWAADHGMPVTNNSYFIDPWEFNCVNDPRQRPVWQAVQRALAYSTAKGTLTVASAGNSNVDLQHKFTDSSSPNDGSSPVEDRTITGACRDLPAEAPGVVTVSAVGPTEQKSYYSSYGQGVVDVTAPGGDSRFRTGGASSTITDAGAVDHSNTVTAPTAGARSRAPRWPDRTRPASRRSRCRRTRVMNPRPARVVPRAHGDVARVPRGRVRAAPGLPGDLHRRRAQRLLRSRQRQRAQRRAVGA